jgi:hypothetical protein
MVLHSLKLGSTEKSKMHVLCFQSSAAGSQAGAAQLVQLLTLRFAKSEAIAVFEVFCNILFGALPCQLNLLL